ncbi:hypothetical protein [Shewanella sp. NIFS-20-20]|uniref:hypothetical protein n=1 Tax=Shewanella sp. NIFS-20-20 TaxID=2853806 RepID=UPI001C46CAF0|nr:hypothetical protein [Shewanella sp. NIFS-20-20]MBV7316144.1 hypothetical protein [Shewanella sp. NIFS-20-20]
MNISTGVALGLGAYRLADSVGISDKQANHASKQSDTGVQEVIHDVLGMDSPTEMAANDSLMYKAGQVVKGAATLGGIIALVV